MKLHVHLSSNWVLDTDMREFEPSETVDFCIVGTGAGGGVLAQRLAKYGFTVVALEAGDWHDSEKDMVSDEAGSSRLYWNDLRITGGTEPLELGANNSGRGVGGSTVHYAAFCPRFHPSDFRVRTNDGVAVDWPISYEDLEPYYERMEREYPVSGPRHYPWGKPHGYPYAPLQAGTAGLMLVEGCTKLGIPVVAGGPVGIPAGREGKRPHCIMRGFCLLGCKVGAKSSILVSHIPFAVEAGAEIRTGCMAYEVAVDEQGRATGVHYFRNDEHGKPVPEFQRAQAVIVAGYAIETPRLLLNSKSSLFPDGLANSSGLVGKNLMSQAGPVVWGNFPGMIRQYKAPPACACSEAFYETDPHNDFVRGYALQTVAPLPIAMAHLLADEDGKVRRGAGRGDAAVQPLCGDRRAGRDPAGRAEFRVPTPDGQGPVRATRTLCPLQSIRERQAHDEGGDQDGGKRAEGCGRDRDALRAALRAPGGDRPHGLHAAGLSRGPVVPLVGRAEPAGMRR